MTRLAELRSQRDFRIEWLVQLDADASRPNDGWPVSATLDFIPEFELLRGLLYPWTPNAGAQATAMQVRRDLQAIESTILMLDRSGA